MEEHNNIMRDCVNINNRLTEGRGFEWGVRVQGYISIYVRSSWYYT